MGERGDKRGEGDKKEARRVRGDKEGRAWVRGEIRGVRGTKRRQEG